MKTRIACLALLGLASCGDINDPDLMLGEIQSSEEPIVYGTDGRKDWYEVTDPTITTQMDASVAIFFQTAVSPNPDGLTTHLSTPTAFGGFVKLCPEVRYFSQPCAGYGFWCTGMLVAPDLVLTADHCIRDPQGIDFWNTERAVFGYRMSTASQVVNDVPNEDVISFAGVVARDPGYDWALVRLSQAAPVRHRPQAIRRVGSTVVGASMHTSGYPYGIPVKYMPGAQVHADPNGEIPGTFMASLDTSAGNSGSSVFSPISGLIEGVVFTGFADHLWDEPRVCWRQNSWPFGYGFERSTQAPTFASFVPRDTTVAAGLYHDCAVVRGGRVWACPVSVDT